MSAARALRLVVVRKVPILELIPKVKPDPVAKLRVTIAWSVLRVILAEVTEVLALVA